MTDQTSKILYTRTDEAPALATISFLPIINTFVRGSGITVETRDISLAGRILANMAEHLTEDQRIPDDRGRLGELALRPEANIIKLPNISASIPQLKAAIKELQDSGYAVPDYPDQPDSDEDESVKKAYAVVLGSAVNPVLREGNSDRRAPGSVKQYARHHPHSMGAWAADSKTHVAHMTEGDFRATEKSLTLEQATTAKIEFVDSDGRVVTLKDDLPLQEGEIIDASYMSRKALLAFLAEQIEDARQSGVLFSLHLKATMMKISDPVIFGHALRVFLGPVFEKHADALDQLAVDPDLGLADLDAKLQSLPDEPRAVILADMQTCFDGRPPLAMVDSDKGITNLHVPSDVIVDASMPAMIRASGQMWGPDGELHDTKAVIPDSSYAGLYQETIIHCKQHGAFDPTTMGSVSNVGLMAKKAEEYGSHDKTFMAPGNGVIRVVDAAGTILIEHAVETGDIWRMCQVKDAPVRDWIKLAVTRARASGTPAIFVNGRPLPGGAVPFDMVKEIIDDELERSRR